MSEKAWVFLERQYGDDLVFGPFDEIADAIICMDRSPMINDLVYDDCLDLRATFDQPEPGDEVIPVDHDDPDQTGKGHPFW